MAEIREIAAVRAKDRAAAVAGTPATMIIAAALEAEAAETTAEPSVREGSVSAPDAGKRFPTLEA